MGRYRQGPGIVRSWTGKSSAVAGRTRKRLNSCEFSYKPKARDHRSIQVSYRLPNPESPATSARSPTKPVGAVLLSTRGYLTPTGKQDSKEPKQSAPATKQSDASRRRARNEENDNLHDRTASGM